MEQNSLSPRPLTDKHQLQSNLNSSSSSASLSASPCTTPSAPAPSQVDSVHYSQSSSLSSSSSSSGYVSSPCSDSPNSASLLLPAPAPASAPHLVPLCFVAPIATNLINNTKDAETVDCPSSELSNTSAAEVSATNDSSGTIEGGTAFTYSNRGSEREGSTVTTTATVTATTTETYTAAVPEENATSFAYTSASTPTSSSCKSTKLRQNSREKEKAHRISSDTSDLPLFGATGENAHKPKGCFAETFTIVKVAVNLPLYSTFDYKIIGSFDQNIAGCRVKITFGRNKQKKEIGIIVSKQDDSSFDLKKLKIATLLDVQPLVPHDLLQTLIFGAQYYHYPIGQALALALPKILREGGPATYKEIPGLKSLVNDSDLDATIESIRSRAQKELLIELKHGPKRRRELREQGFTSAQELALVKKGLVQKIDLSHKFMQPAKTPVSSDELYLNHPLKLNQEQQQALLEINSCSGYGVFLLNGVTGSGKTEVYLQAIAHTLLQGKKTLILVPEIALTPQTFKRFFHRFKVQIATLHSTLSDRERLDGFLDMYNERAMILVGTRSALFTPIPHLGLIVIDEEHDSSFKQNDGFKYHTRTLALHRAQINQCKVVLGSATPCLDSLYQVSIGNYSMIRLTQRAQNSRMPIMQIVDLKQNGQTLGFQAGIGKVLENLIGINSVLHQQTILFINRRGYAHQIACNSCEKVILCPHCDVPMTVHRSLDMLVCHVCNTQMPIPHCCPYCGCSSISENGVGTEQVEQFLKLRFMDVGVERVDRDSVSSKSELEHTLDRIRLHKSEIIVGTQMLAKGHDFPDVTLVGILNVDAGLYSDDFRALEQTVQLITQVAGRAGRAKKTGRVILQTRFPSHQILLRLTDPKFDYTELASEMLTLRKTLNAPPYTCQAVIMANGTDRCATFNFLDIMVTKLLQDYALPKFIQVTPVLPDRIEKKINRYHYHFIITSFNRDSLNQTLDTVLDIYQNESLPHDVRFGIDVDPFVSP